MRNGERFDPLHEREDNFNHEGMPTGTDNTDSQENDWETAMKDEPDYYDHMEQMESETVEDEMTM